MEPIYHTDQIITIPNFWTVQKCQEYIAKSESLGYGPALVQTRFGQRRIDSVRNNERIIHDDVDLANEIWEDLAAFAPRRLGDSVSIGLNERFRFYKYSKGEVFKKHRDGSYIRNEFEWSYYTFMIYLNEDFTGGETTFPNLTITPQTGMALLFYHPILHEGTILHSGTKYILRTDIMYRIEE